MPAPDDVSSITRLQVGVDAVLVPRGFAAGQGGAGDERAQVIWCAAAGDLAARFPGLPTSREPAGGWTTMCTDLVVELALAAGDWCLAGVSLEGHDLDQVLAGLGLADAARRAADLLGAPAPACLRPLTPLLTTLLDEASSPA
ncbi:hypothetical protein [uncultured Pseudokineococcus sp.]|uniref:hypothetical protein n=1 Tax=uncultured Pseudokineococcus sp. TaxID=1642928 RepID=UPI002602EE36|nr:hypothetical protein [uncultured Pseudokineococcus sp.]